MRLIIFNVEHGACALITTANNRRIMIDVGHNSSTQWYPGNYLSQQGITQLDKLCVTNYDEDHVSGLPNLLSHNINISVLVRNVSVSAQNICSLKTEDGMGTGIAKLVGILPTYVGGAPSFDDNGDVSFSFFYNCYPADFDDENNLSLVVFVRAGTVNLVFPGDLEVAGWRKLLANPQFCAALRSTNVFVASHHGRENGYCEDVFKFCKPQAVIVSDSAIKYDSQQVANLYRKHTSGVNTPAGTRHVLTTRRDGWMMIDNGPAPNWTLTLENSGK